MSARDDRKSKAMASDRMTGVSAGTQGNRGGGDAGGSTGSLRCTGAVNHGAPGSGLRYGQKEAQASCAMGVDRRSVEGESNLTHHNSGAPHQRVGVVGYALQRW